LASPLHSYSVQYRTHAHTTQLRHEVERRAGGSQGEDPRGLYRHPHPHAQRRFVSLSLSLRAIASRAPDTTHAARTRPFPFVADEDHKEWYQLNTPKGTGAFLQLGLRYTFLKGKDEGLIVPPLPFAPERFVKKDPTRSPSLSRMTQAKAKGHRAIHRCCDRENVFLVAKDHDEWTALPEHSEEKTGRAFIRGVFGYGNITAFDLSNEAVNLFIQQCPPYGAWTHLGATTTDKGGRMKHEINYAAVPIQKTSGQYPIRCVVGGDFSVAAGQVWVLEHGVGGRSLSLRSRVSCVSRYVLRSRD
jgi:hypothetical protein